jgi:hypothetical protein
MPYFSKEGPLVCCNNFLELVHKLGLSEYNPSEWIVFTNVSKRRLKDVLLHNENVFGSIPIAHSVLIKRYLSKSQNASILDQIPGIQLASLKFYLSYCVNNLGHQISTLYVPVGQYSMISSLDP